MSHKYDLDVIRHSTAHLMAQALMRLYPGKVALGIGPTIEDGFYYDIDIEQRITETEFARIEEEMNKIIKENLPVIRKEISKDEANEYFKGFGQWPKLDLIAGFPEGETISCYTQGEFTDLCRGPHVEKTSDIPRFFKLLHVSGAYWRGDEKNKMLQRIYATCFHEKKELLEFLKMREEALKRDHRKLGQELELFTFDPLAPGSPFFWPKGALVYNGLINFMRGLYRHFGYKEVITPQILDVDLWHTSGHYENYKEDMFFTSIEKREFAIKPMNCPCHMVLYKHRKYSYRDLPLRFADFGRLHRNEKSGTLAGITRVRTFCQDDAHIFLPLDSIQTEIHELIKMFMLGYAHFGLTDVHIALSLRPDKKVGDDAKWDLAENALKDALESANIPYSINPGDGAFYGPKIDFRVSDALKRRHQLGTIQLDTQLPERFDIKFTNKNGEIERPVVIHRALLGSLERFFGIYLEHTGGAFPFWLAPEQAVIIPVRSDSHREYAEAVYKRLHNLGYRVNLDDRNESMGLKTRQAQTGKIPYMLVVGDREKEEQSVSLRAYGATGSTTYSLTDLEQLFKEKQSEELPASLR